MKKYEVVNQKVEIGGIVRNIGDILYDSMFRPGEMNTAGEIIQISEVDSLLSTGHIKEVK